MAMLGGTLAKENGLAGAAVSSISIREDQWKRPVALFDRVSAATLHEWLHQMHFCAKTIMGYTLSPDPHSAEEYGFTETDGGLGEWFASYRALMLDLYPRAFWRTADMRGAVKKSLPPPNASVPPGRRRPWREARDDWQRALPLVTQGFLRARTGLHDLTLSLVQYRPNDYVQLVIGGIQAKDVLSPVDAPAEGDVRLNNVLSLGRPAKGPAVTAKDGGFSDRPIESMALVRYRTGAGHADLLFIRLDVADAIVGLLEAKGVKAAGSVLGFVSLEDPAEHHPIDFLVLETDLGEAVPKDEVSLVSPGSAR
jgi:hypothetical protein